VIVVIITVIGVVIVLMSVNIIASSKSSGSIYNQSNKNKVEPYECGYEPRE
jgi:NADH:ubiquinone oxidoreductase subunit 3 (subunit A)